VSLVSIAVATTMRRRVGTGILAWLGGIGALVAVAHPSSCPAPSAEEALRAARDGVRWIAANQTDDGSFLYRYDRARGAVVPGYSYARHGGTLLALEQARGVGISEATNTAEPALEWAIGELTDLDGDRAAFGPETGATALLVVALVERRHQDGVTTADPLLERLGRFLVGTVTERGSVVATWDLVTDEPVVGSRSPFFTGEILWALARLHAEFPAAGWDAPARRLSQYLVTERDDAEGWFPPVSDHWASYAFAEISAWPADEHGRAGLDDAELAYARRQAGLFGVQARFESQRRPDGVVRLTRGPRALTAGIGTVGEGLGGIWRLGATEDGLAPDRGAVGDRLACVASLLVDRQTHSGDARLDGAWFRQDVTQVDDAQHAISALLQALPVLQARS